MKRWLLEDKSPEARFSMMMDLYALPHDVPGHAEAMALASPYAQAATLEAALADALKDQRFLPYVQVYEFEALLLAAPEKSTPVDAFFPVSLWIVPPGQYGCILVGL